MIIEIDAKKTAVEAHNILEEVEMILKKQIGVEPNIHIDPVFPDNPMVKEVRNKLESISKTDKRIKKLQKIKKILKRHQKIIKHQMVI